MKQSALLACAAMVLVAGCAKSGRNLDGEWSLLVTGSDNGTQSIVFRNGKEWTMTTRVEVEGATYVTSIHGTYKLENNGEKLTMRTIGSKSDIQMEGGTDEMRKKFEADRTKFLESMRERDDREDVSNIQWFSDNSFETNQDGELVTFHRK